MGRVPIAFILGGRAGKRLYPLTRDRTKPAVLFGSSYRVIDFVLSNFLNSKIEKIYILTQYEPRFLEEHIMRAWAHIFGTGKHSCIRLVPPRQGDDAGWYAGTADAVFQNMRFIEESRAGVVDIFCGDHIYLMDVSQMNEYHFNKKADLSISAIPVKAELAVNRYGVLVVDQEWRLVRFEEKPSHPTAIPGMPGYCLASMGNYAFSHKVLIDELTFLSEVNFKGDPLTRCGRFSSLDFGFDVIPTMVENSREIFVYNFAKNRIAGSTSGHESYWRGIGNIDQFYWANMEPVGKDTPFGLNNNEWGTFTKADLLQSPKVEGEAWIKDSIISNGDFVYNSKIENSILF